MLLKSNFQSKDNKLHVLCSRHNNSDEIRIRLTSDFSAAAVVVSEKIMVQDSDRENFKMSVHVQLLNFGHTRTHRFYNYKYFLECTSSKLDTKSKQHVNGSAGGQKNIYFRLG